jgi:hypothetical protein
LMTRESTFLTPFPGVPHGLAADCQRNLNNPLADCPKSGAI